MANKKIKIVLGIIVLLALVIWFNNQRQTTDNYEDLTSALGEDIADINADDEMEDIMSSEDNADITVEESAPVKSNTPKSDPTPAAVNETEDEIVEILLDETLSELDALFGENYDDSALDALLDGSEADSLTESYGI